MNTATRPLFEHADHLGEQLPPATMSLLAFEDEVRAAIEKSVAARTDDLAVVVRRGHCPWCLDMSVGVTAGRVDPHQAGGTVCPGSGEYDWQVQR